MFVEPTSSRVLDSVRGALKQQTSLTLRNSKIRERDREGNTQHTQREEGRTNVASHSLNLQQSNILLGSLPLSEDQKESQDSQEQLDGRNRTAKALRVFVAHRLVVREGKAAEAVYPDTRSSHSVRSKCQTWDIVQG